MNVAKGLLLSKISQQNLKPSAASMLSPKRFLTKARYGQISDFKRQRKISEKGHFVVYSIDEVRFEVPLIHLSNAIFQEWLKMSEDEFGLPANGRITLPCNADFLEYILSLIRMHPSEGTEKALLVSIASGRSSTPQLQQSEHYGHIPVLGS